MKKYIINKYQCCNILSRSTTESILFHPTVLLMFSIQYSQSFNKGISSGMCYYIMEKCNKYNTDHGIITVIVMICERKNTKILLLVAQTDGHTRTYSQAH